MKRSERLELRLYRALLRCYPEKFQHKYGAEMLRTFSDTLQDATLEGRLPSFWWGSLVDSVVSIRRERRAVRKEKPAVKINRYTQESRLVFHYAREEQHLLRYSDLVGAEHILLGVLRDPKVYAALLGFGCTLETVRNKIKAIQGVSATPWNGNVPHIAVETRHVMELASALACSRNDQVINPSHMLLAILEHPSSLAFQVLTSFATPEQIRSAIGTTTD